MALTVGGERGVGGEYMESQGLFATLMIPQGEATKSSDQSALRAVFVFFKSLIQASLIRAFQKQKSRPPAGGRD